MCAMRSTDKGAGMQSRDTRNPPSAESFFVNDPSNNRFSVNLKAFGWSTDNVMSRAADFANQGWGLALTAPPAVTAEWRFARFVHYDPKDPKPIKDQIYKGKEKFGGLRARSATGASYNIAVNKWMKTILLQGVIPPKVSARKNWGRDVQSDRELPELRFPSDFMWNVWSSRGAVPSINRCGIQQISDCATMKLVARLLLAKGVYDLEWYPATNSQWCTDTQEGRALLGKYTSKVDVEADSDLHSNNCRPDLFRSSNTAQEIVGDQAHYKDHSLSREHV
jgi:hypothetical protein